MSGLTRINKKLVKLNEISEKAGYYFHLDEHLASLDQAEILRAKLAQIRKDLQKDKQTKQSSASLAALHDVLLCLAEEKPLNKSNNDDELICPISGEVIEEPVTLSNGYTYDVNKIGKLAADEQYFPRNIGDADIEIDQQDVDDAQSDSKFYSFIKGSFLGGLSGMGVVIGFAALKSYAGINVASFLATGLAAIGVGASVASFVAALAVIAAPVVLGLVIGGIAAFSYYKSHHPSRLEPVLETAPVNKPGVPSTVQAFDGLDVKPGVKPLQQLDQAPESVASSAPLAPPVPALSQLQEIVDDHAHNDGAGVDLEDEEVVEADSTAPTLG